MTETTVREKPKLEAATYRFHPELLKRVDAYVAKSTRDTTRNQAIVSALHDFLDSQEIKNG